MDVGQKIKSLLQEAELYRRQGLLREAIGKYQSAAEILKKIEKVKNRDSLLSGIARKIESIERELEAFESAPAAPEMSADVQDLIKEKFAFAKDTESGALEGAIALAKFGQYGRALAEFRALLSDENVRLTAGKNIIRCHISRETFDDGIEEYRQWASGDQFAPSQLESLRVFFQGVLDNRGIEKTVADAPVFEEPELGVEFEETGDDDAGQNEELLDISSIGIMMEDGPQKDERVEFDVSFQSGSEISLLVARRDQALIEHLKVGTKLKDIAFYSPFAMFQGAGIVTANTKIATGPKRGDFSLDIKVAGN
jgi:tetratricopeptide (TPR) repeat protein